MSFRAKEASRLHYARPFPLEDWLSARARARMKHVIRATRVTQIPDGTRSGLLRPFLVQFSNAPARVFIDMHVRIVDGGRKWTRRACRSVDRKIDRSTDRLKKTSLRRSASPRGPLFFILRRFSFFICARCGQRLPGARLHVWIGCSLVGPLAYPQGTCCVCRSSSR